MLPSYDTASAIVLDALHHLRNGSLPRLPVFSAISIHPELAFAMSLYLMLIISLLCWILSILSRNYSWVDRIWSITPFVYAWIFFLNGPRDIRTLVMALLPTIWGLRLSYNFYRKGGYNFAYEDYRWEAVRKRINNEFLYQLLNFFIIAFYQNLLLWLLVLPMFAVIAEGQNVPFGWRDAAEVIADEQQWNFQQSKHALRRRSKVGERSTSNKGFLTSGLFKYSRHPNFFGEISMWWCYYFFSTSVVHTNSLLNWTATGAVLLTLLFQASTTLTEQLSAAKYKAYARYQQTTSRLIPWFNFE